MLFALLLSLAAPSVAPALFVQDPAPQEEPDLRWDGETEDAYRRALHLWQVRGKPGEAAAILLGIADSQEVTQVAGQASWVLVLAARALAEAGRTDESAALIPGIERGARGSRLEAHVAAELAQLRQAPGVAQQSLDPALLESLIGLLSTPPAQDNSTKHLNTIFNEVRKYDRPILPYLLAVVKRWPAESVEQRAVQAAILSGLYMADAPFVDELLGLLDGQSSLSFISIVEPPFRSPMDETADREQARFWRTLTVHQEEQRRSLAQEALRAMAFRHSARHHLEAVRALLRDSEPFSDAGLIYTLGVTEDRSDPRVQLLLEVAGGASSEAASLARSALASVPFLDELRALAESGDRQDAVRYLTSLATCTFSGGQVSSEVGIAPTIFRILRLEGIQGLSPNFQGREARWIEAAKSQPRDFEFARPWLGDPRFRTLLALVAAGIEDETVFDLAYAMGLPDDEPSICQALWEQGFLPRVFLDSAKRLTSHPVMDRGAWDLIERHAPEEINLELVRSASARVRSDKGDGIVKAMSDRDDLEQLLAIASLDELEENARAMILSRIPHSFDGWSRSLSMLRDLSSGMKPEQRKWVLQSVCNRFGSLTESEAVGLDSAAAAEMLQDARRLGLSFGNVQSIQKYWSLFGRDLMTALGADDDLLLWLTGGVPSAPIPDLVVHALREGASPSAFPYLVEARGRWIADNTPQCVEAARILLARKDPESVRVAVELMGRCKDLAPALWKETEFCWKDPSLASHLASAFERAPDRAALVAKLLEAWTLPGLRERSLMIRAMAATADPRVAPVLLGAIADADAQVAAAAREGLERLKEIEEQRAFWESWQATGVGGSPTAALLRQIQSKNKEVRLSAIRALGAVQAPEALPLLISLLEDPDPEVVAAARAGLAWLKSEPPPK